MNEDSKSTKKAEKTDSIPVPPPLPQSGITILAHKLWVGNLDKRLTEQNILQFVIPYGEVVSFRYLIHKAGPDKGEPRGYCFVEYSTREQAERARSALNGKVALGRRVVVDWAHQDEGAKKNLQTVSETWDASSVSETLSSGVSTAAKIAALEAKLKQMEEEEENGSKVPAAKRTHSSSRKHSTLKHMQERSRFNRFYRKPYARTRPSYHHH